MGTLCESKNNSVPPRSNSIREIETKEEKVSQNQNGIKNEIFFPPFDAVKGHIPDEKHKIIKNQMEKSVCKIIINKKSKGSGFGTGFLCNVGRFKKIKCLITAYHVLGEEELKNEIKIAFNNNEKIKSIKNDSSRLTYTNENDDITIIEIKEEDKLKNYDALEIDEYIYYDNIDFNNEYNNKIAYILHYPEGNFIEFSKNIIFAIEHNSNIYHSCSTKAGSSGAPILNFDTLKVIGIHKGYNFLPKNFLSETIMKIPNYFHKDNKILCNLGKIIKKSILNFNRENKIVLTFELKGYIPKRIYFLQNFDGIKKENKYIKNEVKKIDINDFNILINEKIFKSNFFSTNKEGTYYIKIFIKNSIKDCSGLFYGCFYDVYNLNVDFSCFDSKNITNMSYMFSNCCYLGTLQLSSFDTKNVTNMHSMFFYCDVIKNIDLSSFDTKNVIDMSYMFCNCFELENINCSSFYTKNVINMNCMFSHCKSLKTIDLSSFDTKNITDMSGMFRCCFCLENIDISSFDTKNVINMSEMFWYCKNLKNLDLSSFETKNVTDMSEMFLNCENLENLDLSSFDTKNVTDMSEMFYGCRSIKNIDVSSFDTKNVIYMNKMFCCCESLENLDLSSFDTKKVITMAGMFCDCRSLENLDLSPFDTKNVINMSIMFGDCRSLENLDLSSFDTKKVITMSGMFSQCESLKNLNLSSFNTKNATKTIDMFCGCFSLRNLYIHLPSFFTIEFTEEMFYSVYGFDGPNKKFNINAIIKPI